MQSLGSEAALLFCCEIFQGENVWIEAKAFGVEHSGEGECSEAKGDPRCDSSRFLRRYSELRRFCWVFSFGFELFPTKEDR